VARLLVFMLPLVYLGSRIGRMRGFFAGVALANALFGLAAILYLRALLRRPRHTAYGPERGEGFPSDVPL
jgi:Na+-driven multidrug efflux pump